MRENGTLQAGGEEINAGKKLVKRREGQAWIRKDGERNGKESTGRY